jgi:hypothetical protein
LKLNGFCDFEAQVGKENFGRFNFAIHKEKEMVSFRRLILAMSVLALFVGLASAQVIVGGSVGSGSAGALSCTASVAVPPQLRAEGMTELIGDIVLSCTGGNPLAQNSVIPTANITVSLGTNVTSRLLGTGGSTNASEALLMIDEPGTNPGGPAPAGFGPNAPQTVCSNPSQGAGPGGCTEWVGAVGGLAVASSSPTSTVAAPNVFQGLVQGNQVIFNGIPILPPTTTGVARVFRITNVRANAAGLGGGGLAGTTQLLASVAISGSTSLPVNNPVLIAGFIQSGLTTDARNVNNSGGITVTSFGQCGGGTSPTAIGLLRYNETFGTSFKTRVAPTATTGGQNGGAIQNVPGTIYNSESGFILPTVAGNGWTAGLADYGTRLKAVFNNVPSGVRIFVSTTNVTNTTLGQVAQPASTATSPGFAQLVISETAQDSFNQAPTLAASGNTGGINYTELSVVNNSATAVWEVINTNPAQIETLQFAFYQQFSPNPSANTPTPGTATVNMSFAPTPTAAFSAAAGAAASSSLTVPRFADTSTANNAFIISLCQTVLLYPFVTNMNGFDTGLAVANTTTDPFGTRTQAGTCTFNWYGSSAPTATTSGNIATGTVYTTLASTAAPGFQGYMIAVCNFQLAHGFAFVSDIGARNIAMGYLALILPTGASSRTNSNILQGPGNPGSTEGLGQ